MHQRMLNGLAILGRILVATLFVWNGLAKMFAPSATASYMASAGLPGSEFLAVVVGLFELLAGLALGVGIQTRVAAFALAVFTLLASMKFHNYWSMAEDQQLTQQLLFTKNLALVGALIFIGVIGAGYGRSDSNSQMSGAQGRRR